MRIGGQEVKFSWLIGGGLGLVFLLGLFYDVGQTYFRRKALERTVLHVADISAKYLPFRPQEAVAAGQQALEEVGIKPDPGSITVSPDGLNVDVVVVSEVTAYFAGIVGSPRIKFQASAHAYKRFAGGGPVDQLVANQIDIALSDKDIKPGQNVIVSASGDPSVPDYALKAYHIASPASLSVGSNANIENIPSLQNFSSPKVLIVAVLGEIQPSQSGGAAGAVVRGFAALESEGVDDAGRVKGHFIRKRMDGENKSNTTLPGENDFGLLRGGVAEVVFR